MNSMHKLVPCPRGHPSVRRAGCDDDGMEQEGWHLFEDSTRLKSNRISKAEVTKLTAARG